MRGPGEYNQNLVYALRRKTPIFFFLNPNILYYSTGEDVATEIPLQLSGGVKRSVLTAAQGIS